LYVSRKSIAWLDAAALPVVITAGLVAYGHSRSQMRVLASSAEEVASLHSQAVSLSKLEAYRKQYDGYQAEYDKHYNRMLVRNIGLGVVLGGMSALLVSKCLLLKKSGKPIYDGPDAPLGMRLELGPGNVSPMSLSANLQF
jgi:hypothetical protein